VSDLAEALGAQTISTEDLKQVDEALDSLTNVNSAEDYLDLLHRLGEPCAAEILLRLRRG
jgi:molybdopterin-guanine dinucleotide biosynthesis protein A